MKKVSTVQYSMIRKLHGKQLACALVRERHGGCQPNNSNITRSILYGVQPSWALVFALKKLSNVMVAMFHLID